jgi:hypothetical protein
MNEITYSYDDSYWESLRPASSPFALLVFLAVIPCIVSCALPQIQMVLTGGAVPIAQSVVKIACFGLLILVMMLYGRLDLSSFPTGMWLAAMAYLVWAFPLLWFFQNKSPFQIMLAYNAYYCPLIFAPAACALKGRLSEGTARRALLIAFAACAVVGWSQYLLQIPVVRTVSNDGNFRIYASMWIQQGQTPFVRGFSVFGTALEYGGFAVVIAAIGIGMCGRPGGWRLGVPIYLLAAACCYSTLTRVVFIQLAAATFAALTFTFGRSLRRAMWQPLAGLAVGLIIAFSGITRLLSQSKSLSDDSSLEFRLLQWEIYGSQLMRATLMQKLFGLGFCQADKPVFIPLKDESYGKASAVLIDNLYLALTMHIGLVGMVVILGLFWAMWRHLRKETVRRPTPLLIGIASFWATFLMTGIFNVQPALYGLWFLIAMMTLRSGSGADEEEVSLPEEALVPNASDSKQGL